MRDAGRPRDRRVPAAGGRDRPGTLRGAQVKYECVSRAPHPVADAPCVSDAPADLSRFKFGYPPLRTPRPRAVIVVVTPITGRACFPRHPPSPTPPHHPPSYFGGTRPVIVRNVPRRRPADTRQTTARNGRKPFFFRLRGEIIIKEKNPIVIIKTVGRAVDREIAARSYPTE